VDRDDDLDTLRRALAGSRAQVRALASELTRVEERERRRIAEVLHDHLQQLLVAAKLRASLLALAPDPATRDAAGGLERLLGDCVRVTRSLSAELAPPSLARDGLAVALGDLAARMREAHGLEVELALDPDAAVRSSELESLLHRGARELLFNVVKHAGVRAARLCLARSAPGEVSLAVEDRGRGASLATSSGTGLGHLAERLELLGGRLERAAVEGGGLRVTLVAPLPPAAEPRPAAAPLVPGATARVLLVDDHDLVRRGVADLLRTAGGLEVVGEASDGEEALALAVSLAPDLVLMDVELPRLDGIEAARRILRVLPSTRVLGLSLADPDDARRRMLAAGAAGFVAKDEPPEALLAAIAGALGGTAPR
jgi:CheY-like chemotaxis protein